MTEPEAEALLARLTAHYREPVLPIGRYWAALRTWQAAIGARANRLSVELYPHLDGSSDDAETAADLERYQRETGHGAIPPADLDDARHAKVRDYIRDRADAETVDQVFHALSKSSLLQRLLYGGEKLRQTMCPEHQGRWQGIDVDGSACKHGCGLTGWLPEASEIVILGLPPQRARAVTELFDQGLRDAELTAAVEQRARQALRAVGRRPSTTGADR